MIQKRNYDVKSHRHTYNVGDFVYKLDDSTEVGVSKKLRSPWVGPFLIIEVLSPNLYRVQGRKERDVLHHDKLRLCVDREIPLRMRQMRRRFLSGDLSHYDNDVWNDNLGLEKLFESVERQELRASSKKNNPPPKQDSADDSQQDSETPKETRRGRTVNKPARYLD